MADCHPTGKERAYNLQFYFNKDNVNEISGEKLENSKKKLSRNYLACCLCSRWQELTIEKLACDNLQSRSRV